MDELELPIHSIYLGCDALSQVSALSSPPSQFEGNLKKYYSSINMHLMELSKYVKDQTKDSIVFWFSQRDKLKNHQTFNPADLLGKFDLTNETPQKWCNLTEQLLKPA